MEKASKLPKLKGAEASVLSWLKSLGSSEAHTNVSVFCFCFVLGVPHGVFVSVCGLSLVVVTGATL